jgi:hypothetical protein
MGDAAKIRASVVRKQKTDARDAEHLLNLLRQDRFPQIWRPSPAERDLRQLIWHRQKLVWMRSAVKNQLHALAMGEGVWRKKKLFTAKGRKELEGLALGRWANHRRQELLRLFDELAAATAQLDVAVEQAAKQQPLAVRLMTHPGVGPVTSLAFVLILGPVERFPHSKQVVGEGKPGTGKPGTGKTGDGENRGRENRGKTGDGENRGGKTGDRKPGTRKPGTDGTFPSFKPRRKILSPSVYSAMGKPGTENRGRKTGDRRDVPQF